MSVFNTFQPPTSPSCAALTLHVHTDQTQSSRAGQNQQEPDSEKDIPNAQPNVSHHARNQTAFLCVVRSAQSAPASVQTLFFLNVAMPPSPTTAEIQS